ncbi:anthrone oxygenase family protein [Saccharomonospora cyanea]|uniref:Putative integral membrane protein n=1 Tax=Saccharomonospora cyanea NA-134 TaxID=882082 RepID=H5XDS1_9PSEU|nr:anthrone oxygenase family protein [Saccharomonospora cyanea]EHR62401.1 putative integral membrane protein [Saccharomonospora cyanea NA-134]
MDTSFLTHDLPFLLTVGAALGSGVVAGVLFAFSSFVMRALSTLPADTGIAAMRAINTAALKPAFLSVFGGTAVLAPSPLVLSLVGDGDSVGSLAVGCVLYVAGTVGITRIAHLPRNWALDNVPDGPEATRLWARYLKEWTRWNHVRTATSAAASIVFTVSAVSALVA